MHIKSLPSSILLINTAVKLIEGKAARESLFNMTRWGDEDVET